MNKNWNLLSHCEITGSIPVKRFQSPSGLRLTLIQTKGPLVESYIALATEAHDDDGLPHALEHLVFLGSEDYPYKGLLDIFANRSIASGTNAWTSSDHTSYTLETAGAKGTLKMLPVYLDHILYPILADHYYITEVYHITEKGKDAGVVYSEMQGSENSADARCFRKLLNAAYPNSGYSYKTSGILENLRNSTNNEKIRNYHNKFYRPENLLIVIIGQVNSDEVIEALQPIEEKIFSKMKNQGVLPFVKPWQSPVPSIKSFEPNLEKFPTDSEDYGLILVGWRGPNILTSQGFYEFTACCNLFRYLTNTTIAPFQQAFVETENPYASNVSIRIIDFSEPLFILTFDNVLLNKLNDVLPKLKTTLKAISSSSNSINMNQLRIVLEKQLRLIISRIENGPHNFLARSCIYDVVYSLTNEQFEAMLNKDKIIKRLLDENENFWKSLFLQYFDTDFISVIGSPSTDLMKQIVEEENERISDRQKNLGEIELQNKSKELENALKQNNVFFVFLPNLKKPPSSIFDNFGVVDYDDLKYFPLDVWTTNNPNCPYLNINELPYYSQIHHIDSQFTFITLLMNTCDLDPQEQMYLPLLLELLRQSPYMCEGVQKEHSVLVEEIQNITNELYFNIGVGAAWGKFCPGAFQQTISFHIQCEPKKYERVVELIWNILRNTIFTKSRVLIIAQKMIKNISKIRRQGDRVSFYLLRDLIFSNSSNIHQCSMLRQQKFLGQIIATMEDQTNDDSRILNDLNKTRRKLIAKNNIWLHFAANLNTHQYSVEPWKKYPLQISTDDSSTPVQCTTIIQDSTYLLKKEFIHGQGCIVGIGGIDSCFVDQYSPGPLSYSHPDIPALLIALQYFTQVEGPMWRHIRGSGLTYSFSLNLKPNEGLSKFNLFKATNATQAYMTAKNIVETFLTSKTWDENLIISAKSSLVYDLVKQISSPEKMVKNALHNYYKKVDLKFNTKLIENIMNVNKSELTMVAERWLPVLFDPQTSTIVVVCSPTKVDEMKASFEGFGFDNLKIYKSLEESHMNI